MVRDRQRSIAADADQAIDFEILGVAFRETLDLGDGELADTADLRTRAHALAGTVAGQGPIAARYLKEALLKGADMTLEQGLRLEADLNIILQSTADRAEGIRSFLERRSPLYRNE